MRPQPDARVDAALEDARWVGLDDWAHRALEAVLLRFGLPEGEVSLLGCDDARIAELNAEFRGKPTPTNVLSWPAEERGADTPGALPRLPKAPHEAEWGDVAIAYETCVAEALAQSKPFEAHVSHLLVHGILHLLGFDHENDADAQLMERFEVEILDTLGVPDPYQELDA
jgi:probable rRNA maturation factor